MEPVNPVRFERLVAEVIDALPSELGAMMENVAVVVEDRHPTEDLLGLYEGIPLTERETYGAFEMPDKISVYRLPLCEMCQDETELASEIEITVIHEIAHHFGIDDDSLHTMGWGGADGLGLRRATRLGSILKRTRSPAPRASPTRKRSSPKAVSTDRS